MKTGLEVITGPMFSGKTEELIRRLRREQIAKNHVIVLRPNIDKRYSEKELISHSGNKIPAQFINSDYTFLSKNLLESCTIGSEPQIIGIDEVQFFDFEYLTLFLDIARVRRVIVTGLDTNYRYEPFGMIPQLLAYAEKVDKLTAICHKCGEEATRTQRLIDGEPASFWDEEILVGGNESYEARCKSCFKLKF